MSDAHEFREALRRGLRDALKSRRPEAVSALRTAIATIDNAEAVPVDTDAPRSTDGVIAHASHGVGSAEVPRRELRMADVRKIVDDLVGEFVSQAEHYRSLDQHQGADRLERQAAVLRSYRTDHSV